MITAPQFDSSLIDRVVAGDVTVLKELITLEDGRQVTWADITKHDLEVMTLWLKFQSDVARVRAEEVAEELRRRGIRHLKTLDERELRRSSEIDQRLSEVEG